MLIGISTIVADASLKSFVGRCKGMLLFNFSVSESKEAHHTERVPSPTPSLQGSNFNW